MGFKFSKEPSCIIQQEKQYVDNQMSLLRPTKYFNAGKALSAKYTLLMTMINGEVASAITNTASQTCHLCGTKPSQMNNIEDVVDLNVNEGSLQYGISVLHPWIHMFGCLLHIAYRLEVKQWQVKKNEKHLVEKGKKKIQEKFRQCLGLIVGLPKQGGGTSNDGNTAHTFFKNPRTSSVIRGISEEIISDFLHLKSNFLWRKNKHRSF
jgi:hypothetical protein